MPSDYEQLNRMIREDLPSQLKAFLAGLYDDRTHFILELLQNAEDVNAKQIRFELHADRLEVFHNGRPFSKDDVRAVCSVGKGTKRDDLTAIGRFGIGFKSVYAVTSTPEIHSGDEHFAITDCVQASGVATDIPAPPWTTLFRLPFDHDDVSPETAFGEIAAHLQQLELRTLLFLRHIWKIEWAIVGKALGTYVRRSELFPDAAYRIWLVGQHDGEDSQEQWLVFPQVVAVPAQELIDKELRPRVEVAFRIADAGADAEEHDEQGRPADPLRITRLNDSPLIVFFPTAKMTQLGFLVQGPYRTTAARDNIPKHDAWNTQLVHDTAGLMVKALRILHRKGYLSPELFEIFPIRPEAFPEGSMFRPLFERLKEALQADAFLPDDAGGSIRANEAVLASGADLRALLSSDQLTQLSNRGVPLKWLAGGISERLTPALYRYLRYELGVPEFDPEMLARRISETFLMQQTDAWMVRFYAYLLNHDALWKERGVVKRDSLLRKQPILRLSDGRHVAPFKADDTPAAYLPGPCDLCVPVVKKEIAEDEQAAEFLRRLGLREPDTVDEVCASILPKYRRVQQPNVSGDEYVSDIRAILAAIRTDSSIKRQRSLTEAQKTPFLRATNANTGRTELKMPSEVYMRSDDLALYFSENPNAWFLADGGPRELLEPEDRRLLGIADTPRLLVLSPTLTVAQKEKLREGMKDTRPRQDRVQDYDVDGLAEALALVEKAAGTPVAANIGRVVWNIVLKLRAQYNHDGFWQGRYDWFNYQPQTSRFPAAFLRRLTQASWIPNRNGVLHKPAEIDVSELADGFERHDDVIEKLGLKNTHDERQQELAAKQKYAARLGVDLSIIEFIRQHPEVFARVRDEVVARQSVAPAFPERTSANPARREARVQESREDAAAKTYEKRERSVRTSAPAIDSKTPLRADYTNDDGQMVCQMCEQEMPFKMPPDNEYYFEAVQLTGRTDFEHHAMRLALCPVCAAKYKVFIHRNPEAQAAVEAALLGTDGTEAQSPYIELTLGYEKGTLRFVNTHLQDVKTLLKPKE